MPPWALDVIFFLILLLGLVLGSWRGFVKGICKLAGTIFAIVVAVTFCNPFKNALESWFGMTSLFASGVGETFGSILAVIVSFIICEIYILLYD